MNNKKGKRQTAADRMIRSDSTVRDLLESNVVPLKICKSGLKCTCDLERDLLEMRMAIDFHRCTQCHDDVVLVRVGDLDASEIISISTLLILGRGLIQAT